MPLDHYIFNILLTNALPSPISYSVFVIVLFVLQRRPLFPTPWAQQFHNYWLSYFKYYFAKPQRPINSSDYPVQIVIQRVPRSPQIKFRFSGASRLRWHKNGMHSCSSHAPKQIHFVTSSNLIPMSAFRQQSHHGTLH
jgi:hypothetical protein